MAAIITVDLEGLARDLEAHNIDPGTVDYTRALTAVSVYLWAQAKRCFVTSSTPDGVPWPPFKRTPSRRRGGRSAKLLIDTGLLMASTSARNARGAVRNMTRNTLEQGSNLFYAGFQNDGTRAIPARPFVGITAAMADRIADIVADDIERQLTK
jgi:phage gpG-like protein